MEMNVSVEFQALDKLKFYKLHKAFKTINNKDKESDIEEFNEIIVKLLGTSDLLKSFKYFYEYLIDLESLNVNPPLGIELDFVTGGNGDVFANELKALLTEIGVTELKMSIESV